MVEAETEPFIKNAPIEFGTLCTSRILMRMFHKAYIQIRQLVVSDAKMYAAVGLLTESRPLDFCDPMSIRDIFDQTLPVYHCFLLVMALGGVLWFMIGTPNGPMDERYP